MGRGNVNTPNPNDDNKDSNESKSFISSNAFDVLRTEEEND